MAFSIKSYLKKGFRKYKKLLLERGISSPWYPHYHVLLWVEKAPVIGIDPDNKVLDWIQMRITCRIPDESSNPDLYSLVKKYQLHKCSG